MNTAEDLQKRIRDLEVALYSLLTLQAVAQGLEKATTEERQGVELIFASTMENIKKRVVNSL
jgi:hypothetical protein